MRLHWWSAVELMAGHDRFVADLRPLRSGSAAARAAAGAGVSSMRRLLCADRGGVRVIVTDLEARRSMRH